MSRVRVSWPAVRVTEASERAVTVIVTLPDSVDELVVNVRQEHGGEDDRARISTRWRRGGQDRTLGWATLNLTTGEVQS